MSEPRIAGVPGPGAWAFLARSLLSPGRFPLPPGLASSLGAKAGPLVLVLKEEEALEDVADSLKALDPLFPPPPPGAAFFGEDPQGRLAGLERLHAGARLVLATPQALACTAPGPLEYGSMRLMLRAGAGLARGQLLEQLAGLGYRRADFAEGPGEFAARGSVVDVFPIEPASPLRVLYDDDRIASLRPFDPQTQGGLPGVALEAFVPPAAGPPGGGTLRQRLAGGTWLVEDACAEDAPEGAVCLGLGAGAALDLGARESPPFPSGPESFALQARAWAEAGVSVLLFSTNRGEDERLQELLEGRVPEGAVQFLVGPLRRGFTLPAASLAVVAASDVLGRAYRPWRGALYRQPGRPRARWGMLKKGDYVVHEVHGVARYAGMEAVREPGPLGPEGEPTGAVHDCLRLEFRGEDAVYVPMSEFKLVQKYVGAEGHRPRLSSLDARSWGEVKERVREGVRELAEQLLKTQAERAARPGHAFPPDSRVEQEFAESFPYEETPDQARAIAEVKADMEAPRPMDRVVVGDVGFGKTEVAMRAALKCVCGLKQAVVLVPTTILCEQHLRSFRRRFSGYPVRVEALSRFVPQAEARRVLADTASGRVDVLIGTQRLLQKDVVFKELGLVVIDEEHRFGVRDKERLKAFKASVDLLSLSATPIPRTLHQALTGLRGVSLMQSAPAGRQPVVTSVRPFDEAHAAAAIQEEIGRGGQVFYVHNRVRTLAARLRRLSELLPGVRFVSAHGQMGSERLEAAMWDFYHRKSDVLVASAIIESGLDIPSVNTMLVENAQDFGLSQLYQLRGRIGRERRKAFCHLYFPASDAEVRGLTEEGRRRLEALREFGELGSGLGLAMRDLEIRGAGDLLGARQHGFIDAVGVEFYSRMLEEEISFARGGAVKKEEEPVRLDLDAPAHLPESYLPGDLERLEFYKRILNAPAGSLPALRAELEDFSGPAPEPVRNLFRMLELRAKAAAAGIGSIQQRGREVEVLFRSGRAAPAGAVDRWLKEYGARIRFVRASGGEGFRLRLEREAPLPWLEDFLGAGEPRKKNP